MRFLLIMVSLLSGLICFWEGRPLYREKRWKDLTVLGMIIAMVMLIGLIQALGLHSPLDALGRWLRPLGEAILGHREGI